MRRASFTSSFTAPVMGSDSPALSAIFETICMSLSAQVNEIWFQSSSACDLPELICSASRSVGRSMPVVSAMRPASISAEHHLVDLLVVADAENDERDGFPQIGGRCRRLGAHLPRLGHGLRVDVADRQRVVVADEVLGHGETHPSHADD